MLLTYLQGQEYPILIFVGVNIKFVSQHKHLDFIWKYEMEKPHRFYID